MKYRTVRDKNEPWLSDDIIEAIYEKDKAWKKTKKTKDPNDIKAAKILRNAVKNMVRVAKADFVQDYLDDVIEVIKDIDVHMSASIDDLSTRVLKDSFEYLVPQLTYYMFNCSLRTSLFPD